MFSVVWVGLRLPSVALEAGLDDPPLNTGFEGADVLGEVVGGLDEGVTIGFEGVAVAGLLPDENEGFEGVGVLGRELGVLGRLDGVDDGLELDDDEGRELDDDEGLDELLLDEGLEEEPPENKGRLLLLPLFCQAYKLVATNKTPSSTIACFLISCSLSKG